MGIGLFSRIFFSGQGSLCYQRFILDNRKQHSLRLDSYLKHTDTQRWKRRARLLCAPVDMCVHHCSIHHKPPEKNPRGCNTCSPRSTILFNPIHTCQWKYSHFRTHSNTWLPPCVSPLKDTFTHTDAKTHPPEWIRSNHPKNTRPGTLCLRQYTPDRLLWLQRLYSSFIELWSSSDCQSQCCCICVIYFTYSANSVCTWHNKSGAIKITASQIGERFPITPFLLISRAINVTVLLQGKLTVAQLF